MIKIKLKIRHLSEKTDEFTVYLKFTDGIEPILITTDFGKVLDKITAVKQAIQQVTNYPIEWL